MAGCPGPICVFCISFGFQIEEEFLVLLWAFEAATRGPGRGEWPPRRSETERPAVVQPQPRSSCRERGDTLGRATSGGRGESFSFHIQHAAVAPSHHIRVDGDRKGMDDGARFPGGKGRDRKREEAAAAASGGSPPPESRQAGGLQPGKCGSRPGSPSAAINSLIPLKRLEGSERGPSAQGPSGAWLVRNDSWLGRPAGSWSSFPGIRPRWQLPLPYLFLNHSNCIKGGVC